MKRMWSFNQNQNQVWDVFLTPLFVHSLVLLPICIDTRQGYLVSFVYIPSQDLDFESQSHLLSSGLSWRHHDSYQPRVGFTPFPHFHFTLRDFDTYLLRYDGFCVQVLSGFLGSETTIGEYPNLRSKSVLSVSTPNVLHPPC